jgi:hypothetical protein
MAFSYSAQPNPASQQQYQQPQANMQAPSPYKAPDMSAYSQPRYDASNVPRTAPQGARVNDLSGNVPSNQVWGQAYNQAVGKSGLPGVTSFTLPGTFISQSFNPATGKYGEMTGGQSFDGNMAYNAINNRPSPVSASSTFAGGDPMDFQRNLRQREAFVGNLSQRLNQYSGGQLTGPVTFDPSQLMSQANEQLSNGTFYNPFAIAPPAPPINPAPPAEETVSPSTYSPEVQRAMSNANQYMQGNFQNPFGEQANVPTPSFSQMVYSAGQAAETPQAPSAARPIAPPSQGTSYNPQAAAPSMPNVPASRPKARPAPKANARRSTAYAPDGSSMQRNSR